MFKLHLGLKPINNNESGQSKIALSLVIFVLVVLILVLGVVLVYVINGQRLPWVSTGDALSLDGNLPPAPDSWVRYEDQYVSFKHPPDAQVEEESPGHQRQKQSMAEGFGYKYITGLRIEKKNGLIASIHVGDYLRDQSRSEYYDYRKELRADNEGVTFKEITVNEIPVLLFQRLGETVNTSRATLSLDAFVVTEEDRYLEISSATYSGNNRVQKARQFKRILTTLQVED